MRKFISALLLAATAATPLLAQPPADPNAPDRRGQWQDRRPDRGLDRVQPQGDAVRAQRGDYNDRRDDRAEFRNDLRDDRREDRREDRRDYRGNDGRNYNGGFNGSNRAAWNNNWRQDRRYDWQGYRNGNRQAYRLPRYYGPGGSYRRFGVGYRIGSPFYSQRYWIADPYAYRLPPAYGPYRWVRYYDDVLLIDVTSGFIRDSIYGFFG